jgi:hypothetical protein
MLGRSKEDVLGGPFPLYIQVLTFSPEYLAPHTSQINAQLGHLKRVKRDRATGALAAILSTPDRYAALEVRFSSSSKGDGFACRNRGVCMRVVWSFAGSPSMRVTDRLLHIHARANARRRGPARSWRPSLG